MQPYRFLSTSKRNTLNSIRTLPILIALASPLLPSATADDAAQRTKFVEVYCQRCHGGDEDVGSDFNVIELPRETSVGVPGDSQSFSGFAKWKRAVELVSEGSMPPADEVQPPEPERLAFESWFSQEFLSKIKAAPGKATARRLSVTEYRNTLRSLIGADLELAIIEAEQTVAEKSLVKKLLPTDPPGPSGYTNDTSENPITTQVVENYAYFADLAIEKLLGDVDGRFPIPGGLRYENFTHKNAQDWLEGFKERAFRRPSDPSNKSSLQPPAEAIGEDVEVWLRQQVRSVLLSPAFLYRGVLARTVPTDSQASENNSQFHLLDDHEYAERLSYFLWADMPDQELLDLASNGSLQRRSVRIQQVARMLRSPRSRSLADDFGMQWFSLDQINDSVSNNPPVLHALQSQPLDFFHYLFQSDRPLTELIDSKTTFVNTHTSKFYPSDRKQIVRPKKQKGIEVMAYGNQRIELINTPERGGLPTMPGVLAMNRGPILRGTWLLERVLGEHLPDPPPDVGQVQPSPPGKQLSFRERFEAHRSNESCAVCHDKIDPLGFALAAYDEAGVFKLSEKYVPPKKKKRRAEDMDDATPDTHGKLPSGEEFENYAELKKILLTTYRRRLVENIVRQTMSYALCRKLEYFDTPTIERIVDELESPEATFHQLVFLVTESLPFRYTQED